MAPVYQLLHARGLTATALARAIGCKSHAQVSLVLNNRPGRGGVCVRRRLAALLTRAELDALGWRVPRGT